MTTTDTLAECIGRILNEEGWTFEGVHEPGEYDECEDCRLVVDPIAARIATVAHAHLAAQEPTDAEVEAACAGFYNDPNGLTDWTKLARVDPVLADRYRAGMRRALPAARTTRRDEEKRDD
ncbi:hypothetical protein HMPREF1484_00232 [Dermabacter sp. HFH0086]|uniref:hypothetical protein n=1 Tax=Dermabacter TaxID=36739 RepID=UPI000352EFE8|nr:MULTISPECIES: hypothetical protein [Dermabacter]EPH17547.1 hypothetical protein HMPREF1484_00232 [Dermabacter sp. HFH0086]